MILKPQQQKRGLESYRSKFAGENGEGKSPELRHMVHDHHGQPSNKTPQKSIWLVAGSVTKTPFFAFFLMVSEQ